MSETALPEKKLGHLTRMAFGVGGAAGGIKNNGFDYALLIFYSQALGLPSWWVAGAIWIALIFFLPLLGLILWFLWGPSPD